MKQKVKQKTGNTIEINKPSKYKTFVVYEHDEFNKKIYTYLGQQSKKVYNQYIFCYQIYELYKKDIYKSLYLKLKNGETINCEKYVADKLNDSINNYINIKLKIQSNNAHIYHSIKSYFNYHNIILKNSNYDYYHKYLSYWIKTDQEIFLDGINDNVLYYNIVTKVLISIYMKNYNTVKNEMLNHQKFTINDSEIINDIKNNNIRTFELKNRYKNLILRKFEVNITSDQNIVAKIVRVRIPDIVKRLDSTLVSNVMIKAFSGYSSYYKLKQLGYNKANKPKFLKEDVFNLIYTYSKVKEDTNNKCAKLLISTYISKNFNELFPDYIQLCNNKYIDKKYLIKIKDRKSINKKDNYIINDNYIPKNNKNIYDSRYIIVNLDDKILEKEKVEIEIVFKNNCVIKHIKYENEIINNSDNFDTEVELSSENCISIDLGVKNLLSIYDPIGQSYIIPGNYLTSINYYYNKKIGDTQRKNNKKIFDIYQTKRKNIINNYFNLIIKWMENKYKDKKTIIIGYNKDWKNEVSLGSTQNMRFYKIPYCSLLNKIKDRFSDKNIAVILQEESYTSKCDSIGCEEIKKHDTYMGKRVNRGLFSSSKHVYLNADINGAINIMRKLIDIKDIENNKKIFNPQKINIFREV
jgi:putative transposase